MLHARIRTADDAFHFIAEVNSYNLQTLRQHLRQSLREGAQVQLSLHVDAPDELEFARYTAGWLPELIEAGIVVDMDLSSVGPTMVARPGAAARQSARESSRRDRRR
jgi:hypothetical protein